MTPPLRWTEQVVLPMATAVMGGLVASAINFTVGKFDNRLDKVEVAVVQLERSVDRLGVEVMRLGEKVGCLDSRMNRLDTKLDILCGLCGLALVAYLFKRRD